MVYTKKLAGFLFVAPQALPHKARAQMTSRQRMLLLETKLCENSRRRNVFSVSRIHGRNAAHGLISSFSKVAKSVPNFLTTTDPHRTRQNVRERNREPRFHVQCGGASRDTTLVLLHASLWKRRPSFPRMRPSATCRVTGGIAIERSCRRITNLCLAVVPNFFLATPSPFKQQGISRNRFWHFALTNHIPSAICKLVFQFV